MSPARITPRSSKTHARKRSPKKRSPAKKRAKKVAKKPAKKRAKKAAKKVAKKRAKKVARSAKRSAAAKKGWEKRRKKQALINKMVDLRMQRSEDGPQPLGWTERRQQLRLIDDTLWRKISLTFDPEIVNRRRLEVLKELDIDLLTKYDLHDYLAWFGEEEGIEISDMYRMYLGYPIGDASPE